MRIVSVLLCLSALALSAFASTSSSSQVYPRRDMRTAYEVRSEVGLEITVRLASGNTIAVVQAADSPFAAGDQARVLFGPEGSARVSHP